MGVNIFPSGGGGSPIKSIQRGVASSAGSITISAVNTEKTMLRSFSTGSSGTVAATGAIGSQSISANVAAHSISGNLGGGTVGLFKWVTNYGSNGNAAPTAFSFGSPISAPVPSFPISTNAAAASIPGNIGSTNISGGSTNLTSAEFGIYLVNSTTIQATGACRWEVIEFN